MKMKRFYLFTALFFFMTTVGLGQISPKVKDIKRNPRKYRNEVVAIDGFVTQFVEDKAQTTDFYYLKDDWGGLIKVRTSAGRPEVGRKYRVTGPLSIDIRYREPFISEEKRELLEQPIVVESPNTGAVEASREQNVTVEPVAPEPQPDQPVIQQPLWQKPIFLIVGGAILLLVLIIILVAILLRSSTRSDKGSDEPISASDNPAPGQTLEGKTIKMQVPPPGTLKLLPGRLEVLSGDDTVKEIRFYKPKGVARPEVTFGRAQGPAYSHVQLKAMTVSSRQAKMVFDGATVFLINYASSESNPTLINGREMAVEESVPVNNGDTIAMGEVKFKFHAN